MVYNRATTSSIPQLLYKNKHIEATFRVQAQEAILLRV